MLFKRIISAIVVLLGVTILPSSLFAGILKEAPFIVSIPNEDWSLHDSTGQPNDKYGGVASIVNVKLGL
jgi:hypothetical protein